VPSWRSSPRQTGFILAAATTTYHPIRGAPLIGIIGVAIGGGWGRGLHSRRWQSFSVSGDLLVHLFFFIRVVEDDDFAIARWPKDTAVEVIEESPIELLILRGIRVETFLIRR
jgi:hypothetical protein